MAGTIETSRPSSLARTSALRSAAQHSSAKSPPFEDDATEILTATLSVATA